MSVSTSESSPVQYGLRPRLGHELCATTDNTHPPWTIIHVWKSVLVSCPLLVLFSFSIHSASNPSPTSIVPHSLVGPTVIGSAVTFNNYNNLPSGLYWEHLFLFSQTRLRVMRQSALIRPDCCGSGFGPFRYFPLLRAIRHAWTHGTSLVAKVLLKLSAA